ncbi:MAG TPA: hypothetical protein VMN76_11230 [Acidobacteriota bacterium]|nr:hypothetical protein [Acidobacteriota bacterium]
MFQFRALIASFIGLLFGAVAFGGTPSAPAFEPALAALADLSTGPKPSVFLRGNEVVFLPGESITLTVDIQPNGHNFPKTFFMYLQNMDSGEIRYFNIQDGLLPASEITDLNGESVDNVQAFPVPGVQDLTLLGPGGIVGGALAATNDLVGNHQLVLELRDVSGRRVFQRSHFPFAIVQSIELLPAEIVNDAVLDPTRAYFLDNRATFVREGASLTIPAGTYLLGQGVGALIIDRGGKIFANGTQSQPVVLTSAASVGDRRAEDWGGLIINGRAPVNIPGGVGQGEGDTGAFGGDDPDDDSGVLRYVRVEFAGIEFSPDNELNGIAFQGVGRGTVAEYLQVHFNKDDGVEFFGGTVNVKYVLLTSNADDSLDWTEGWIGKAQFMIVQQNALDADNGIEADNNAENNELLPRSNPSIYNITFIGGQPAPDTTQESDNGFLIREGTAATIRNAVVTGFGQEAVLIDQDATIIEAQQGNVRITNSVFFSNAAREPQRAEFDLGSNTTINFDLEGMIMNPANRNRVGVDPKLRDPFNLISPDYRPAPDSPLLDVNWAQAPPDDGFFSWVNYVGAMDAANDWTVIWTNHAPN